MLEEFSKILLAYKYKWAQCIYCYICKNTFWYSFEWIL